MQFRRGRHARPRVPRRWFPEGFLACKEVYRPCRSRLVGRGTRPPTRVATAGYHPSRRLPGGHAAAVRHGVEFHATSPTRKRMSIVWTILIGFVAGLVARAIKPGDDSAGFIITTLIGIAGSLIATYVGQA